MLWTAACGGIIWGNWPWLRRIADRLREWQSALNEAARDIPELDPNEAGAPGPAAARIERALAADDWRPLAADLAQGFPMNLLGG